MFRLIVPLNDDVPSASEMNSETTQKTRVENKKTTLVNDSFDEKTRVGNQKTRVEILNLIKNNPNIKTVELAEKFSITQKGVEWQLKQLRDSGVIRHVGATKNGHWEVLKGE